MIVTPARTTVALLILVTAFTGAGADRAHAQSRDEYFRGIFSTPSTYDSTPMRLQIGAHSYDVPKNMLFAFPSKEPKQRAVLLQLLYPEMEGLTRANASEMKRLGQDSRRLQILISDFSLNPHPQTSAQAVNTIYRVRFGFHDKSKLVRKVPADQTQWRLSRLTIFLGDQPQYELFVDPNESGGARSVVIDCVPIEKYPNPGCSLVFAYRDIVMRVRFVRTLLSKWSEIRAAVTMWMDRSRVE
jgi:hypothetical protein